ncbi:hypothetical protein DFH09DRAFT_1345616 [Mycena vulgaris]|nr:hypothetical protein DFH09DRAFT_1345616 [Mycena vulgaris]
MEEGRALHAWRKEKARNDQEVERRRAVEAFRIHGAKHTNAINLRNPVMQLRKVCLHHSSLSAGVRAQDICEKNARPVVRFERQLAGWVLPGAYVPPPGAPSLSSLTPAALADATARTADAAPAPGAETDAEAAPPLFSGAPHTTLVVPPFCGAADDSDTDFDAEAWWGIIHCFLCFVVHVILRCCGCERGTRRQRACEWNTEDTTDKADTGSGRDGTAPGRIGRVYELESFSGLRAGTMLGGTDCVLGLGRNAASICGGTTTPAHTAYSRTRGW